MDERIASSQQPAAEDQTQLEHDADLMNLHALWKPVSTLEGRCPSRSASAGGFSP
jgi:hypothetical protein